MSALADRWDFDEERNAAGVPGVAAWVHNSFFPFRDNPGGLDDCLVTRVAGRPWFIVLWEPLKTDSPGPNLAEPYCCYLRTVIFYHRGHPLADDGKSFKDYGQVETRLMWDDLVRFEGEIFKRENARVVWSQNRWWMRNRMRRQQEPK